MTTPSAGASNPFGRWSEHRARIAALSRPDAGKDPGLEARARQLLTASRLADAILAHRAELTDEQRRILRSLLDDGAAS